MNRSKASYVLWMEVIMHASDSTAVLQSSTFLCCGDWQSPSLPYLQQYSVIEDNRKSQLSQCGHLECMQEYL